MWGAAAALTVGCVLLALIAPALAGAAIVVATVVILGRAVPYRLRELGGDELRNSRPDRDRGKDGQ